MILVAASVPIGFLNELNSIATLALVTLALLVSAVGAAKVSPARLPRESRGPGRDVPTISCRELCTPQPYLARRETETAPFEKPTPKGAPPAWGTRPRLR